MLPWVFNPQVGGYEQFRLPKGCFLDFIFMGIISFSFLKGLNSVYRNKYLGWLVVWVFITIGFNWYDPMFLYKGGNGQPALSASTIVGTMHFILAIWASFIAMSYFDREDYLKISKYICFSAVLTTLYAIMQVTGFDPLGKYLIYKNTSPNHFSALIDHPNTLGNYLAISIPFFFVHKEIKYIFGLAITLFGLYMTHSSISILAFIFSAIFYLFLKYRNKNIFICFIFLLLSISGLVIFLCPDFNKLSSGLTGRMWAWKEALNYIKYNPIFGLGIGVFQTFQIVNHTMVDHNYWQYAHNDWLERWAEIGLFGVFLCFLVISNSFRNFNYKKDNLLGFSYLTAFISFLVITMGSFPLEIPPLALVGMISFWGTEKL